MEPTSDYKHLPSTEIIMLTEKVSTPSTYKLSATMKVTRLFAVVSVKQSMKK